MKESSNEGQLPNREPQAPRQIAIETVDRDSRPAPYNRGGEAHILGADEPCKQGD
jgi:hypothetical protein